MRELLVILIMVAAAAAAPAAANDAGEVAGWTHASYVPPSDRLDPFAALEKINALRAAEGLGPVALDPLLTRAAAVQAEDLAARDDISHFGADGSNPVTRVAATGYDAMLVGENVSTGQRDLDEVLAGWMHSESHRKTLMMPEALHVGLALVYDPKTSYRTFWTMVIAEPF